MEYNEKLSKKKVKIFQTPQGKVLTFEHVEPDCIVDCSGCSTLCCKGMFAPTLTPTEFLSGKYPTRLFELNSVLKKRFPKVDWLATLDVKEGQVCRFLTKDGKCSIWEKRPKACKVYDCREDPRPEIKKIVIERFSK